MTEAMDKIITARMQLLTQYPFFGILSMKWKYHETTQVPTMGTDGPNLYYNPDFVLNGKNIRELQTILAHELMHIILEHPFRKKGRHHMLFNIACDYAINPILEKDGFTLPEGILLDKEFYDMSAEAIYEKLLESQKEQDKSESDDGTENSGMPKSGYSVNGNGSTESNNEKTSDGESNDSGQSGNSTQNTDSKDGAGSNNPDISGKDWSDVGKCGCFQENNTKDSKEKARWKIAISEAMVASKGSMSANMKRLIEDVLTTKISWQEILKNLLIERAKDDFSMKRPNKRFINRGFILPSPYSETLPPIYIAIDTSGSITNKQLGAYQKELNEILMQFPQTVLKVMYCDTEVAKRVEFSTENLPVKLEAIGGGGTDFRPVFEKIKEECMDINQTCLIYFTDLYGNFPTQEPPFPTIWVVHSDNTKAPFGKVIKQEIL
jgi:predicted metal-dependent peptidase